MTRLRSLVATAVAVLLGGALASACTLTPPAATVAGQSIPVSTLYGQLRQIDGSVAGACLLQLLYGGTTQALTHGTGTGPEIYTTQFAAAVLNHDVDALLTSSYAASRHVTVSAADLTTARSALVSNWSGQLASLVQSDPTSACADGTQGALTGQELVDELPASVVSSEVRNEALSLGVLGLGISRSPAAVRSFYQANQAQFAVDCLSIIAVTTEAQATGIVTQLQGGASFAALAKADSIDTQHAAQGGAQGCTFTRATVEGDFGASSVSVGQPLGPVPDNGAYVVGEVTSEQVLTLAEATPTILHELPLTNANVLRFRAEVLAYARTAVSINPKFGTWNGSAVVPPSAPPARFLLPTALRPVDGIPGGRTTVAVPGAPAG